MKFKHRIWLLPVMTAVIVTVGIAINSRITSNTSSALARAENVRYPSVEALRTMRLAVVDVQESLQRAVAEGDQQAIAAADQHAGTVRYARRQLAAVDAQSKLPRELEDAFDAYYDAALSARRTMLGTETGDTTQAIARMQKTSEELMGVLTQSQEAAIEEFRRGGIDGIAREGADSADLRVQDRPARSRPFAGPRLRACKHAHSSRGSPLATSCLGHKLSRATRVHVPAGPYRCHFAWSDLGRGKHARPR